MPKSPPSRTAAEQWGRSTPTKRLSAEDTRRRLLDTALDMLQHTGLTVSLEHLNMEVLIREADVPRSSVFRLWGSKSKFFAELMLELIKPEHGRSYAFDTETLDVARAVIAENEHRLHDVAGRTAVMREAIRRGVARNYEAVLTAHTWKTHSALIATLPSLPEEVGERVLAALQIADREFTEGMAIFYESLLSVFQLKLKDGLTCMDVAAVGASLVQGMTEKALVAPDIVAKTVERPGLDGEPVEWTLAGIAFFGVIEAMTEPIGSE